VGNAAVKPKGELRLFEKCDVMNAITLARRTTISRASESIELYLATVTTRCPKVASLCSLINTEEYSNCKSCAGFSLKLVADGLYEMSLVEDPQRDRWSYSQLLDQLQATPISASPEDGNKFSFRNTLCC
jgi:hypothetical protein